MARVLVLVGTRKGAFLFWGDPGRRRWRLEGPHLKNWAVQHMIADFRGVPVLFAAVDTMFWGSTVYRSEDGGRTWKAATEGPRFAEDAGLSMKRVWHVEPGHPWEPGVIWAGVDPAALFKSEDGGRTWRAVPGLLEHPTRPRWQPGGGGLCLHTIVGDPREPKRLYVAISAAGVFRTDDGGQTWTPANRGVRADFLPDKFPEVGQCVHKMVLHPARPDVLYQQNHCGVYASGSRGERWRDISHGLPSRFGFPLARHAHDPETLYTVPLVGDQARWVPDGKFAVYQSRDGGKSWRALRRGLPQRHAYLVVLREGLATDACDPCGVYVGTSTGQLYISRDEGRSWAPLAEHLPPILSVTTALVSARTSHGGGAETPRWGCS